MIRSVANRIFQPWSAAIAIVADSAADAAFLGGEVLARAEVVARLGAREDLTAAPSPGASARTRVARFAGRPMRKDSNLEP